MKSYIIKRARLLPHLKLCFHSKKVTLKTKKFKMCYASLHEFGLRTLEPTILRLLEVCLRHQVYQTCNIALSSTVTKPARLDRGGCNLETKS